MHRYSGEQRIRERDHLDVPLLTLPEPKVERERERLLTPACILTCDGALANGVTGDASPLASVERHHPAYPICALYFVLSCHA